MLIFGSSRLRTLAAFGTLILGMGFMLLAPLYGPDAVLVLILGLLVVLMGGAIRMLEDEVRVWSDGTWIRHWGLTGRAIGGRGDLVGVLAERHDGGAASYEHAVHYRLVFRFRDGRDIRIRVSRRLKERLGLSLSCDAPQVAAAINDKLGLDPLRLRLPSVTRPARQAARV